MLTLSSMNWPHDMSSRLTRIDGDKTPKTTFESGSPRFKSILKQVKPSLENKKKMMKSEEGEKFELQFDLQSQESTKRSFDGSREWSRGERMRKGADRSKITLFRIWDTFESGILPKVNFCYRKLVKKKKNTKHKWRIINAKKNS